MKVTYPLRMEPAVHEKIMKAVLKRKRQGDSNMSMNKLINEAVVNHLKKG